MHHIVTLGGGGESVTAFVPEVAFICLITKTTLS